MTIRRALAALALTGLMVAGSGVRVAAQCAMCKTALTGSPEGQIVAGELNHAILVMLASPYVVFAVLAAILFRKPLRERLGRWRSRGHSAS